MSDYKDIIEIANIGADFKTFVTTNVGSYILEKARQEEIIALRDLATVDPDNKPEIHRLQLKAAVPMQLLEYIDEVITAGKTAEWQLDQEKELKRETQTINFRKFQDEEIV